MKTTVIQFRLTVALCNAAIEFAEARGITLSDLVRAALAEKIGKPDLSSMPLSGRPAKKRPTKTAAK